MTTTQLPGNVPTLFAEVAANTLGRSDLKFEPLQGRNNAEIHRLYTEEEGKGASAALVRYLPGGEQPAHLHKGFELIYMLEGEMHTTHGLFKANDLIVLPPGSTHSSRTDTGCLALVVWNLPVEPL